MGDVNEMQNMSSGGARRRALDEESKEDSRERELMNADEQWERITERGSVLSRYIYQPKQKDVTKRGETERPPKLLNWAFFSAGGTQGHRSQTN